MPSKALGCTEHFSPPCSKREPPKSLASEGSNPFQRASMGAASLWGLCTSSVAPHTPWGGTSCQLVPNLLPSGFPPLPLCGDIPAHGAVFPALVCTIGMLINPEPEAIRLQRLYKMCLVVVCFFLISANYIFREKGPELQREIKKKKTLRRKDCGCQAVEKWGASSQSSWASFGSKCGLIGWAKDVRLWGPLSIPRLERGGKNGSFQLVHIKPKSPSSLLRTQWLRSGLWKPTVTGGAGECRLLSFGSLSYRLGLTRVPDLRLFAEVVG